MVSGTDTGNIYALQADRYYDVPDEEPRTCSECWHFAPCPCGCHWGICTKDGEWSDGEITNDECEAFEYCEERFRK